MNHSLLSFDKFLSVKAFVFDVDGVLTDGTVQINEAGDQLRTFNIKDGYALQLAVKTGYHVAAISGGKSEGVRKRLKMLGVQDIFLGVTNKENTFKAYCFNRRLHPDETLFMGDDIPDLGVMNLAGFPVCPNDAVEEIKAISEYISIKNGGAGCVRDVIEKVMKLQGTWMMREAMSV
ncbi:MAG: HAD-IIIA family hydrolase [Mucilaginibacter polytrichastri]|nr:HAD-IIIA family hydrolase [Mucilaginibacter polytrichastri]